MVAMDQALSAWIPQVSTEGQHRKEGNRSIGFLRTPWSQLGEGFHEAGQNAGPKE